MYIVCLDVHSLGWLRHVNQLLYNGRAYTHYLNRNIHSSSCDTEIPSDEQSKLFFSDSLSRPPLWAHLSLLELHEIEVVLKSTSLSIILRSLLVVGWELLLLITGWWLWSHIKLRKNEVANYCKLQNKINVSLTVMRYVQQYWPHHTSSWEGHHFSYTSEESVYHSMTTSSLESGWSLNNFL